MIKAELKDVFHTEFNSKYFRYYEPWVSVTTSELSCCQVKVVADIPVFKLNLILKKKNHTGKICHKDHTFLVLNQQIYFLVFNAKLQMNSWMADDHIRK